MRAKKRPARALKKGLASVLRTVGAAVAFPWVQGSKLIRRGLKSTSVRFNGREDRLQEKGLPYYKPQMNIVGHIGCGGVSHAANAGSARRAAQSGGAHRGVGSRAQGRQAQKCRAGKAHAFDASPGGASCSSPRLLAFSPCWDGICSRAGTAWSVFLTMAICIRCAPRNRRWKPCWLTRRWA